MKWTRSTNYRNSRIYEASDPTPVGQLSLITAWLANGTKRTLQIVLDFVLGAAPPRVHFDGEDWQFTTLGSERRRRSKVSPFPDEVSRSSDDRDWRVLP
jgi:hypothetical protein